MFLPISLAQMFLAGCWLGSYFFLEDCEREKRKNWISSDETWHCGGHAQPTFLGLISRGLRELERRKNWIVSKPNCPTNFLIFGNLATKSNLKLTLNLDFNYIEMKLTYN